jgi:hypothetical protein
MLELLLHCYIVANLKYPGYFAAIAAFIATVKAQCDGLFMPVAPVASCRNQLAPVFENWTEQELARWLARLEAYVASMA